MYIFPAHVRCGRSRFRANAVSEIDPATARHVLERISLPRTSPYRMPPLLSGELPDWAIARVAELLEAMATSEATPDSLENP